MKEIERYAPDEGDDLGDDWSRDVDAWHAAADRPAALSLALGRPPELEPRCMVGVHVGSPTAGDSMPPHHQERAPDQALLDALIARSAHRMARLVDDLLELTAPDPGPAAASLTISLEVSS